MYEQGVIRPPSEASSLLVRVTRNCPWNQCLFCPAYKGMKFSKRSVEEVKKDIDEMAKEYKGYHITSVFLQDGDSLLLPTKDLLEILNYIRKYFPGIERVTTYARSRTVKRKSVDELKQLKEAGLTRIHIGMESGSAKVLDMVRKGLRPDEIIEAGRKVMDAGISLSEYIMPGLGGRTLSDEHARETARVLNAVRPDFIRVRTFAMHPMSPMQRMVKEGLFVPMNDAEIVAEIRLLVENLDPVHSYFSCADFSLNLLMHVDGYLDEKKEWMLKELDNFLGLTKEQKQAYVLLERSAGYMRYPVDIVKDPKVMDQILPELRKIEATGDGAFDAYIAQLMSYQLPQPQTDEWN